MDYEKIKKDANNILANRSTECSYIEYKASALQLGKILKTICAYGNNYYDNDIQYIFLGVDEEYDLLRKFSNFHFSSLSNNDATIDDLNVDFLREYLSKTSD